jgi:hypothetical protein
MSAYLPFSHPSSSANGKLFKSKCGFYVQITVDLPSQHRKKIHLIEWLFQPAETEKIFQNGVICRYLLAPINRIERKKMVFKLMTLAPLRM